MVVIHIGLMWFTSFGVSSFCDVVLGCNGFNYIVNLIVFSKEYLEMYKYIVIANPELFYARH